jgi:hypothetical protein
MGTPTTDALPFWKGKDSTIVFFLDDKQVKPFDVIDWEIQAQGEKVQDAVCGEDRDRLEFVITHYNISLNLKQQRTEVLDAILEHQNQVDSRALPKPSAVAFILRPNDGTKKSYEARGYCPDDWSAGTEGRVARNKFAMPGRSQYFKPVKL